jgi:hypothetical protein
MAKALENVKVLDFTRHMAGPVCTMLLQQLGAEVIKSLRPGQVMIKIVNDELTKLMGPADSKIYFVSPGPTVILLAGLQGSGKTTTAAKLANRFLRELDITFRRDQSGRPRINKPGSFLDREQRSSGDYLVILDGDCVVNRHFLADHLWLAETSHFVQGKRVLVGQRASRCFTHKQANSLLWVFYWLFTIERKPGKANPSMSHYLTQHFLLRKAWGLFCSIPSPEKSANRLEIEGFALLGFGLPCGLGLRRPQVCAPALCDLLLPSSKPPISQRLLMSRMLLLR